VHLVARPVGEPKPSDFKLVERELPDLQDGEVLVRNSIISVDPYMRGRMNDVKSYVPPFNLGEALQGGAIGRVEASRAERFKVGDLVQSGLGWRTRFVANASALSPLELGGVPMSAYLGIMGGTGLSAYVGLLDLGQPKSGETVFVSAAAGAVGSAVCQIAKLKGCRVVGSASSDAKVAFLVEELGIDAGINYRTRDLEEGLSASCPNGVDVYFDNVGGDHLQAALNHMNPFGRIVACGMISQYNNAVPAPGPNNLSAIVRQRLTVRGFIVSDHFDRRAAFAADMSAWLRDGKMKNPETMIEGIEQAPQALIGLLRGENLGKMLVRVGPN
jgi:NADPH-dependent curcumin reductase CurA